MSKMGKIWTCNTLRFSIPKEWDWKDLRGDDLIGDLSNYLTIITLGDIWRLLYDIGQFPECMASELDPHVSVTNCV